MAPSTDPLGDTASYFLTVFRIVMYLRPLRVFFPLALSIGALATARGSYNLLHSPLGLHDSDVILVVTALLTLIAGLLADLIVKQRHYPM